jgi:hypothetical protein
VRKRLGTLTPKKDCTEFSRGNASLGAAKNGVFHAGEINSGMNDAMAVGGGGERLKVHTLWILGRNLKPAR